MGGVQATRVGHGGVEVGHRRVTGFGPAALGQRLDLLDREAAAAVGVGEDQPVGIVRPVAGPRRPGGRPAPAARARTPPRAGRRGRRGPCAAAAGTSCSSVDCYEVSGSAHEPLSPRGSRSSSTSRRTPSRRPSPSGRPSPGGRRPSDAARTASSSRCCRRQGRRTSRCRPSTAPAGLHLDLDSADRPATIERARGLGATTAWTYHDVEVMRSPGGFTFCQTLVDGAPVPGARRGDDPRPGLPRHPVRPRGSRRSPSGVT